MAKDLGQAVMDAMKKPSHIRNIAIAAHIDHGKSTLSDNLLAGAGMISEELAGKQRFMDFHEDEAQRGITIDAANVSMVHNVSGEDFLINLIDTPGHVDFGGDVTRAMRAVDGAVVLSCAVEGIMPQTETVLRQALKEKVKPILFINKVDRLIKELKLTPQMMQDRFVKIINQLNVLIEKIAPKEYKQAWKVNVADGSVMFGSAYSNWALSVPYMQEKGIKFGDIIDIYEKDDQELVKKLAKDAPLHVVLLNSVVKHLPNPIDAQKTMKIKNERKPYLENNLILYVYAKRENTYYGRVFYGKVRENLFLISSLGNYTRIDKVYGFKNQNYQNAIIKFKLERNIKIGETLSIRQIPPIKDDCYKGIKKAIYSQDSLSKYFKKRELVKLIFLTKFVYLLKRIRLERNKIELINEKRKNIGLNVLILGDSVTSGLYVKNKNKIYYKKLISEYNIYNLKKISFVGCTLLKMIKYVKKNKDYINSTSFDVIILEIEANDLVERKITPKTFLEELKILLSLVEKRKILN